MWRARVWGLVVAVVAARIAVAAPQTALGEQTARQVWIGETRQEAGQGVVPVAIDEISGVVGIDLDLVFDSRALTVVEVRKTALLSTGALAFNTVDNTLKISFGGSQRAVQGSGTFLEVVVQAAEGATVQFAIRTISSNVPMVVVAGPPSSGGGDTPPSGGGETPPSGGGDTPPSGGGETPPSGGGETPPSGGGDTPPSGGGETPPSGGGGTSLDQEAPPAPATFTARVGLEQAVLSWSPSAAEDLAGYTLYRRASDGAFVPVATGLAGTSYRDQGLLLGVPYTYYVKAVDRAGNQSGSSPLGAGTPSPEKVPGAVEPVAGVGVDGAVVLTVGKARPVSPGEALTYTFQVSASISFEEVAVQGMSVPSNSGRDTTNWRFAVEELVAGQAYWWRVRASDAWFDGPWSAPVFLDLAPLPPSGFVARVGLEQAVLWWSPPAAEDLAGYTLYRKRNAGDFAVVAAALVDTFYLDQGLLLDTLYMYYATAVDRAGNESKPSLLGGGTPSPENLPGPVQTAGALVADGEVALMAGNARPARLDGALTYTFQVSVSPSFEEVVVQGRGSASGRDTTRWDFAAEELVAGQVYWWRARASDAWFDGPWSAPVFLAGPLADPGDFDGDGRVYFDDFFLFADRFGTTLGERGYERVMDLSGDGQVEWEDFFLFAELFGAVYRR